MKKKPFLELYKQFCENNNTMSCPGLCGVIDNYIPKLYDLFELFKPTDLDSYVLAQEGKCELYWGSDSDEFKLRYFTDLRKNIVLFLAAMNNEL